MKSCATKHPRAVARKQRPAGSLTAGLTHSAMGQRWEWAWRRGRVQHEYWPGDGPPPGATVVPPDLEDIVIALSLARRNAVLS